MSDKTILNKLNSFDPKVRLHSLKQLIDSHQRFEETGENVNMHFHSFFSYNAESWSPSRIAWEAREKGLYAAGIIDFDVLDGMHEFIEAGEILGLRSSVGIETRAFFNEFADKEIDSPGEPGVSYIAGAGFYKSFPEASPQQSILRKYSKTADERNIALINRINSIVQDIAIDYQKDVLPLTPSGNATERHIIEAYVNKSFEIFPTKEKHISFWSGILNDNATEVEQMLENRPVFESVVRKKFSKKGGLAYVAPTPESFPKVEEFFDFVKSCRAIPMESWLDGTSEGESDARKLLESSRAKGAMALNLIPERNWNVKDPEQKLIKLANLKEIIEVANSMEMPLHIGTEMNKKGLPFVDDLSGKELNPFKPYFLRGARIFVGHTILGRFADFPYSSQQVTEELGGTKQKNDFFEMVGALPPLTRKISDKLKDQPAEKAFSLIKDATKKGKWTI